MREVERVVNRQADDDVARDRLTNAQGEAKRQLGPPEKRGRDESDGEGGVGGDEEGARGDEKDAEGAGEDDRKAVEDHGHERLCK